MSSAHSSSSMTPLPSTATSVDAELPSDTGIPTLSETSSNTLLLCNKLLELGTDVPSVAPTTSQITTKLQTLWRALDILGLRLRSDDSVHNEVALVHVDAICVDVQRLSVTMERLVPTKTSNNFTYRITVRQRVWATCKNTGLKDLLNTLDFLHCTVQLLVTTLMVGEKVRWARAFGRGHGRAQNNVMFETLRLEDRPAKECLANRVLSVARTFCDTEDLVPHMIPPFLKLVKMEIDNPKEAWDEEQYREMNMRIWWDLLLDEWTTV